MLNLGEGRQLVDETGKPIGLVPEDLQEKLKDTPIKEITPEGEIIGEDGKSLGTAEALFPKPEGLMSLGEGGNLVDENGTPIGHVDEGLQNKLKDAKIKEITPEGDIIGENGRNYGKADPIGAAEEVKDEMDGAAFGNENLPFKGLLKAGDDGKITDEAGNVVGHVPDDLKEKLKGATIRDITPDGDIIGEDGEILGKATPAGDETVAAAEEQKKSPFPRFRGSIYCDESGKLKDENGKFIGSVNEDQIEDLQDLPIRMIDADGTMYDEEGNNVGIANPPEPLDYSILDGATVTKSGKVVDSNGSVVGNLKRGNAKTLEGSTCDENGDIWDKKGKKVGHAEPLPNEELAEQKVGEFDDFPDNKVAKDGFVYSGEDKIGKVIEGDPKKLAGKTVDPDGEIVDKNGNVLGRAERYDEPEVEEEVKDQSLLAGKRVNKAGNVVDDNGSIIGKLVEGDPKKLAGKMCGKNGEVFDEGGNVVGRAELIDPSEREGQKEGPFSAFQPCTVVKDGTVQGQAGNIVGRLIEGNAKQLEGRQVDQDGDIVDSNGNSLGKAERWEPEEKEKERHPASGLKVNREGWVMNEEGDAVAKLTEGEITRCRGKEVNDDGDVVNQNDQRIGSVTLVEDLKPEGKSQEEIQAEIAAAEEAAQKEKEDKLARRMCFMIDERLDKINRILKAITDVSAFTLRGTNQANFLLVHQRRRPETKGRAR